MIKKKLMVFIEIKNLFLILLLIVRNINFSYSKLFFNFINVNNKYN